MQKIIKKVFNKEGWMKEAEEALRGAQFGSFGSVSIGFSQEQADRVVSKISKEKYTRIEEYIYINSCLNQKDEVVLIVSDLHGKNIQSIDPEGCQIFDMVPLSVAPPTFNDELIKLAKEFNPDAPAEEEYRLYQTNQEQEMQRERMREVLRKHNNDRKAAAEELGISEPGKIVKNITDVSS